MLTKVFLTLYNIKLQKFEIIYKNSCHFYLSILGKFQRRLWPVFSQIYFHMQPNLGDIHCCRSWCLIHKPVWSFSHTHSCMHLISKIRLVKTNFKEMHIFALNGWNKKLWNNKFFLMFALLRRTPFWPPSMVYISSIIAHITNYKIQSFHILDHYGQLSVFFFFF